MKYSNYIGVAAATGLIASCFMPWIYIASLNFTVTGFNAGPTNFGHAGLLHVILAALSVVFFLAPKVWAKRANLFVVTLNLAWAVKNFLVMTQCEMGECPEKRVGIYAALLLSIIILIMALLPKLALNEPQDK